MRRLLLVGFLVLSLGEFSAPARAQVAGGIISNRAAGRFGLQRTWFSQVQLGPRGRLNQATLWVSTVDTQTLYEVTHEGRLFVFSERHLDAFGNPYGPDGAKLAAERKVEELKELAADRQDAEQPQVQKVVVPETTLYVSTDLGVVQAIDAETGQTRWTSAVGNPSYPTLEVGANNRYVATINGSSLYVLSARTGEVLRHRPVVGVPGAGPALSEEFAYIPTINGALESYMLNQESFKRAPYIYTGGGRAFVQPTVTPRTVSWVTDQGHMLVGNSQANGILYRLNAHDAIVSRSVSRGPNFLYVASLEGYVYCVTENTGDIIWRFAAGESISHEPVAVGENLYVISDAGSLFNVGAETGTEVWRSPDISRFLTASTERLYCVDRVGRLAIVDRKSGGRIATVAAERVDMAFTNTQTDRIYVASRLGTVQCLREVSSRHPLVHSEALEEALKPQDIQQGEAEPAEPMPPPDAPMVDPFQQNPAPMNDPFRPKQNPPVDDPFRQNANPAPADDGADPFSAQNPFGD